MISLFFGIKIDFKNKKTYYEKYIYQLMLFVGIYSFSQEAGKAGELLKNEVSKNDIESSNVRRQDQRNNNSGNSGFRNNKNSVRRPMNPNYQWNINYGSSEVFLRIPEQGYFSVELEISRFQTVQGNTDFLICHPEEFRFLFMITVS